MHPLLSSIESAADLHGMTVAELKQLADEIRDALCSLLNQRTAHFASNLGVVELCLGLHSGFDFRRDRATRSILTSLSQAVTTSSLRCGPVMD